MSVSACMKGKRLPKVSLQLQSDGRTFTRPGFTPWLLPGQAERERDKRGKAPARE